MHVATDMSSLEVSVGNIREVMQRIVCPETNEPSQSLTGKMEGLLGEAGRKGKPLLLLDFPDELLNGTVEFLDAKDLCALSLVCKRLKAAVDSESCWKINCRALWTGKAEMPFSYPGASERLFAKIRMTPEYLKSCSLKDLKEILVSRKLDFRRLGFLEKSEFREKVRETQPEEVNGFSQEFSNKWKASYAYSLKEGGRTAVTEQELASMNWSAYYKIPGETFGIEDKMHTTGGKTGSVSFSCKFKANGWLETTSPRLDWRKMMYNLGKMGKYDALFLGPNQPFIIYRCKQSWRWILENGLYRILSEHFGID